MPEWSIRLSVITVMVVAVLVVQPMTAAGQTASGIAGVVRDASGGVLPGVTVEASSPALIEKVRVAVTDGQGRYSLVDLRLGTYAVTFTLPGFATLRREGIVLTTGFTATINAELSAATIEETVVVTGESPLVDTQNVRQQTVVTNEVIEALPVQRSMYGVGQLIPGVVVQEGGVRMQDVGGSAGEGARIVVHGSRESDTHWLINGLPFNSFQHASSSHIRADMGEVEEFVLEVGGISAEHRLGGAVMNLITKAGGNDYRGHMVGNFASDALQSDNYSDELRNRGLVSPNRLVRNYDIGGNVGGPIKRDKLWFFGHLRYWGVDELIAGVFYDSNTSDFAFTPDTSRQAHNQSWHISHTARMTWQAAQAHRLTGYITLQPSLSFSANPFSSDAPEFLTPRKRWPNHYSQVSWTSTLGTRLLLEAGLSRNRNYSTFPLDDAVADNAHSMQELSTGVRFGAPATRTDPQINNVDAYRFVASYVTGSHAFKAGITAEYGFQESTTIAGGGRSGSDNPIALAFLNGVPSRITLNATPRTTSARFNPALGLFAQDQWTINRLTLHLGVRYDYLQASVPAQSNSAVRFLPETSFGEVRNVPNWKDVSPRLGFAYDLFGNGRTALKMSYGGYVINEYGGFANAFNPRLAIVNNANRTWTDLNGNFVPECDFLNPTANAECGPLGNLNFGRPVVSAFFDPAVLQGSGVRPYQWSLSSMLSHELSSRMALALGYHRRWFTNHFVTENRNVGPDDYDTYCITVPTDSRLPGSGQPLCGLYDIKPEKFGNADSYLTSSEQFGKVKEVYDGMDLSLSARLAAGTLLQGSVSAGRTRLNSCFTVDSPQGSGAVAENAAVGILPVTPGLLHCNVEPPFLQRYKLLATYPLAAGIELSGTFQSLPGTQILASYTARNAEIAPSLGRNLSSGANGTVTIPLVAPGTLYGDRVNQVDLRVSWNLRRQARQMRLTFDVFNVMNNNTVLAQNNTFGPQWQRPTAILSARVLKFGAQLSF